MTSELLFEMYNAPSVTYGIDSLFAFSRQGKSEGLSIGMGHNATTIIPVVGGKGILSRAKRLAEALGSGYGWLADIRQDTLGRITCVRIDAQASPDEVLELPYQGHCKSSYGEHYSPCV